MWGDMFRLCCVALFLVQNSCRGVKSAALSRGPFGFGEFVTRLHLWHFHSRDALETSKMQKEFPQLVNFDLPCKHSFRRKTILFSIFYFLFIFQKTDTHHARTSRRGRGVDGN